MRIEFIESLAAVEPEDWNALWQTQYPFTRYEFLAALEKSGCTTVKSGWQPQHCLIWENKSLIAAMPLYVKTHSYGEYVFDWSWANAYHQNGFEYYPKIINAIPFTPATGPRWAIDGNKSTEEQQTILDALFNAVVTLAKKNGYSGFHSLFTEASQRADLLRLTHDKYKTGFLSARIDCQYHWFNFDFANFTDFLETFNSRKRKNIKKERQKIVEQNISVAMIEGEQLTSTDWQYFHQLYQRTYLKRSGHTGYLNEAFFQSIGRDLAKNVVIAKAVHNGEWVAAALYLRDDKTLYGRYWGATEELDSVHFECCYYQGIEYAIANKLQRFDPGAQGEHKIPRGFTPIFTSSLHHISHPGFAKAIDDFLQQERNQIKEYCQQARMDVPFREGAILANQFCLIDNTQTNPCFVALQTP